MNILFPASPINPRHIDEAWAPEAEAALAEGFTVGRVDLEAILGGEIRVRDLPETGPVMYRGWLMTPSRYEALHEHLGKRLVTPPEAYNVAYHLPNWYLLFAEGDTPRTLVVPSLRLDLSGGGELFDLKEVAEKVLKEFETQLSKSQQERVKKIHDYIETGVRPTHGSFAPVA